MIYMHNRYFLGSIGEGMIIFLSRVRVLVLPPSQNIVSWSVQILCQNIRSWKDMTKLNEVGE
jgi:hypothetical protein